MSLRKLVVIVVVVFCLFVRGCFVVAVVVVGVLFCFVCFFGGGLVLSLCSFICSVSGLSWCGKGVEVSLYCYWQQLVLFDVSLCWCREGNSNSKMYVGGRFW